MKNKIGEVIELFSPTFDQEKTVLFNALVNRIGQAYPHYRAQVIQNELNGIIVDDNNIEDQKYKSALNILIDLVQQGWQLEVHNGQLFLKMSAQDSVDKGYIRFRLSSERKAQFQDKSVMRFVEKMEATKQYNNKQISIRNLIGSSDVLIEKIQNGDEPIVRPYIQLISHQKDVYTGYWLSDIWRYFRYTWAIPYKTMPGRNLFYLVRDAAQPFHPIIGIFALGNSVLNLTVRDDEIGWTVEAISKQLLRKKDISHSAQIVSGTNGKTVGAKIERFLETDDEYEKRIREYSSKTISILMGNIESAIKDLYVRDLDYHRGTKYPKPEKVDELIDLSNQLRDLAIDNKKTTGRVNFEQEAQEILFKKKRAAELARLLEAKIIFNKYRANDTSEWLKKLMASEEGRKAVNVALVANRKTKIGSNMMEIIVCGSIPPYNQLLGGKLVSILACSPQVVRDYTYKYADQVSEIASRMKGEKVVRDSRLAFLGTTSLYSVGSSVDSCKKYISDGFTIDATLDDKEHIRETMLQHISGNCQAGDAPLLAVAKAIQFAIYTYVYPDTTPSDFCNVLGSKSGFVGPYSSKYKRLLINRFLLETIVLSIVSTEKLKAGIDLRELGVLLRDNYNIIIGTDTDVDYSMLEEYGIARATPEDLRGELPDNAKEIANMLISMGLAKRYADGVTLIGWEV